MGLAAPALVATVREVGRELGYDVFALRHLEELPFPEVAARMGRTVDSVQKLWVRALARLRQSAKDFS